MTSTDDNGLAEGRTLLSDGAAGAAGDLTDDNASGPDASAVPRKPESAVAGDAGGGSTRRTVTGIALLFVCIASFITQTLFANHIQFSLNFHKPFFIFWIAHSLYLILFPLQLVYEAVRATGLWTPSRLLKAVRWDACRLRGYRSEVKNTPGCTYAPIASTVPRDDGPEPEVTTWGLLQLSFKLAVGLNVPSYIWYIAVTLTTMANLTAIYNTAALWAWIASVLLLRERVTVPKVLAVFLSVSGVWIMSAFNDQSRSAADAQAVSVWAGNLLALVGAMLYGLYEVLYKVFAVPEGAASVRLAQTLTSMIGFITLATFWVFIPLLDYVGFEIFELPSIEQFGLILVMASLGVAFNSLMMLVIALTTPVFAAVGIMVTIPLMTIIESAQSGALPTWNSSVGCAAIFLAFLFNFENSA